MAGVAKVFELNREGFNVQRGLIFMGVLPVPAIILTALDKHHYLLSSAPGGLLVGRSDAGGKCGSPAQRMAKVAMVGALLRAWDLASAQALGRSSRRPPSWSRRWPVLALVPMGRQHEC